MSQQHNLVFFGEILPGHEPGLVRDKVSGLFNLSAQQCDKVFSGQRVILKSRLATGDVERYVAYLEELGVRVSVDPPLNEAKPEQAAAAPAQGPEAVPVNPFANSAWASIIQPGYVRSQGSIAFWVQLPPS